MEEGMFQALLGGAGPGQQSEETKNEIIKILGVGGAGCNAVNNMFRKGIQGVNYVVCNTDLQALLSSPVKCHIQLGRSLTYGLGAGSNPEQGRQSAIEAQDEIRGVLGSKEKTRMVFITAGMGGGTGTGAAPEIAKIAKELDILTVGIVTIPYESEGRPRLIQAIKGVQEMSKCVDSLIVINSEKLNDMYPDMELRESLTRADEVLSMAAKGLAEMITKPMLVNIDFADVKRAMENSGVAVIGTAEEEGEDRAEKAVAQALNCPLINNSDIKGSRYIIASVFSNPSKPIMQREQKQILSYLNERSGGVGNRENTLIWGFDDQDKDVKEGALRVTIIATGFSTDPFGAEASRTRRTVHITPDGAIENTAETEEASSFTISFTNPEEQMLDDIRFSLYNTNPLDDPDREFSEPLYPVKCLKIDSLSEESIRHVEETPAYMRRKTDN